MKKKKELITTEKTITLKQRIYYVLTDVNYNSLKDHKINPEFLGLKLNTTKIMWLPFK